jgi:aryl-alcohol dehydrogenase-like predicted oxidoreductase
MIGDSPLGVASRLGFGAYRIVSGNDTHRAALEKALDLGCTLIDTASNYGDGRSEQLIGEVLAQHPAGDRCVVVTKVGYVTPSLLPRLGAAGIDVDGLRAISEESRYSLAPQVMRVQMAASRERLQRDRLDAVLLHNPEHAWGQGTLGVTSGSWRDIAREAFEVLEEQVSSGMLRCYGVSSNTLPGQGASAVDDWLAVAKSVSARHHLRIMEFPFNLCETAAAQAHPDGSLIERIRSRGLTSIGNRPLSSDVQGNGLVRFADYQRCDDDDSQALGVCVDAVDLALKRQGIEHTAMEFMVLQFLRDNRNGVDHPELLDLIFAQHVQPLVRELWAHDPRGPGPEAFARLHTVLRKRVLARLSEHAQVLRSAWVKDGVLESSDTRHLAVAACDFGLRSNLDHVVVGMRCPEYVETLRPLLAGASA